jgi:hypothetical protein
LKAVCGTPEHDAVKRSFFRSAGGKEQTAGELEPVYVKFIILKNNHTLLNV